MVSIRYENIGVAYDDFVVVKGFNLEIPHGTITTLLGPSGCGKTTVLRALAGFVEPFEGKVHLGENDITLLPPQKRNTAMIFQNYALWPHLTIYKNVEYGLKLRESEEMAALDSRWYSPVFFIRRPLYFFLPESYRRRKKFYSEMKDQYFKENTTAFAKFNWFILYPFRWLQSLFRGVKDMYLADKAIIDPKWAERRKKVFDALKLVHLEDQAPKLPTQLSGGQQQRIALCRAIVVEPDVLLCDEPLSNLDAKLRKEIRTEIRSIIKNIGMTTVYVTHDQEEALAISDRIAVLHEGIIQQYGTPTEVFTDPHTLFVAQFIGNSSTMEGIVKDASTVELKGGEIVKINVKKNIHANTEVSLVVRPEDISLTHPTESPIDVKINTIEYLGTEVKMTATLKDDTILLIDVLEEAEKYAKMKVGDSIKAYINPEKVFVFVDEERIY
jgi:ABC-type Fe3+/spermidine/putrescine transport system ATPase subunit